MKNGLRTVAAAGAALAVALGAAGTSAASGWGRQNGQFVLTTARGALACDGQGRLFLRAGGQPPLEVGLFLWHDAYVFEALASGKVESEEVDPDGALCVRGLWGARDGAKPVRYVLRLAPGAMQVDARLEVEKTGELALSDGVWATVRTTAGTDPARRIYLFPCTDAPLGADVSGVFKRTYVGPEAGPSVFFGGEGLCRLRSRVGGGSHTCEVKFSAWRDFPAGEKRTVLLTLGWADMPGIVRPKVADRAALSLAAEAPRAAALYGLCEIDVALRGTWDNPYDPDDVALDAAVTTASGRTYVLPGFFMLPQRWEREDSEDLLLPSGNGRWKVRLAATEPGPMHVTLTARDRSGRKTFELPEPIRVAAGCDGGAKGFVRVSRADAHYFAFDGGAGFVPIGHNVPICRGSNGMSVREITEKMSANGENWNRWWLSKDGLGLEWEPRLGWYRQAQAAKLDRLLEDAARLGLYYQLCMDTHQDFRQEGWKGNPFNVAQGGPCKTAGEWFTNADARAFYRKRLRYTVARWSYSPHVFCWEFGNEFEGWADTSQESILAWHREMAPLLASLDPYGHLISTSWWSKTGPEACWQIPALSFVQTHSYANNDLNTALEAHAYCLTQWAGFQKPHLFAEFGIRSHNFSPDADPTGRAIHNSAWASLASGCCGTPMPWWHENYIEPKNLYFHFRAFRNFVDSLPFGTEPWRQVAVQGPSPFLRPARPSHRDVVALTCSGFRKPAANLFSVSPDGRVSNADELLSNLHGAGHCDLTNPPTFEVTYPRDGAFVVHVDRVSNSGLLRIFVDGALALEKPLPCGEGQGKTWRYVSQWKLWESVYDADVSVPVTAGAHSIRVENRGKDWVAVARYVFAGCRSVERQEAVCYALASPSASVAWIQNGDSTWLNHALRPGEIAPLPAAEYALEGFADGAYDVEWWETWKGCPQRRERAQAANGRLVLRPGPVATDVAARITPVKSGTVNLRACR